MKEDFRLSAQTLDDSIAKYTDDFAIAFFVDEQIDLACVEYGVLLETQTSNINDNLIPAINLARIAGVIVPLHTPGHDRASLQQEYNDMITAGTIEAFMSRFQVGEAYKNHCNVHPDDLDFHETTIRSYNEQKGFEEYVNQIADQ